MIDTGLLLRFQVVRYNYAISQRKIEKLERSLCFLFLLFHLKVARSCSYKRSGEIKSQRPALSDSLNTTLQTSCKRSKIIQ